MAVKEIREQILDLLEEVCEDDCVREDEGLDLFGNDLLDSLTIVELLVGIENQFGLVIPPTEITKEDIGTPARIIALIQDRLSA